MNGPIASPKTQVQLKPPPTPGPQTFETDTVLRCAAESRLLRISVEVTQECNLRCTYCYVPVTAASGPPLTLAEILQIAEDAHSCGARTFVIIGGEPLLFSELRDLIKELSAIGFNISLFSNLSLLTRDVVKFFFEYRVFVTGKLNSLDATTDDQFASRNGFHKSALKGISFLKEEGFCEQHEPMMSLHTVIAKENVDDVPELFRWMRKQQIVPHMQLLTRAGRGAVGLTPLSPIEARDLFYNLLRIDEAEFGYTWTPTPPLVGWSCQQYYCGLYVVNDGRAKACSSSQTVLGSLREQPLLDLLQLPAVRHLREPRKRIEGQCASCQAHPTCYGCRADAEGVCGSIFAPDQYCWRE